MKPQINPLFLSLLSFVILVPFLLIGCKGEISEPLMGEIHGTILPSVGYIPTEILVKEYDRSGEAFLISGGDTIGRQKILSKGFFYGGKFSFPGLEAGSYDLLIRKSGFIPRYFRGIFISREKPFARGYPDIFYEPTMVIDSLEVDLFYNANLSAFGMDLEMNVSQLEEGPNQYLALFSKTKNFPPEQEDFRRALQTRTPMVQDTIYVPQIFFEAYDYLPGETIYIKFAPQSRAGGDNKPFGKEVNERGLPYIKSSSIIEIEAIVPRY